jgi:DNA-binding response OmpR family regulator
MHATPLQPDPLGESTRPGTPLVIIAIDDDEMRDALADQLDAEDYQVVAIKTGSELMQYLYNSVSHQPQPDVVVCSAALEGIDGSQVCKISRAQNNVLPFIVLARSGEAGAFDALELGDDARVFTTPVDVDELKAEIARLTGA